MIAAIIIVSILSGISVQAAQTDFSIAAKSAVLMEPFSGKILFEQDAHQRLAPASVTKVMTMLLILEAVDAKRITWDEKITTTAIAAGMGGSQIYLKEGEEMTLDEMFKAIAVVSANDASTAVAEHLYGTDEDFVIAMNQRARQLGLKDTHFANETGLPDPEHYSSAYDLAVISRELLKHPVIFKYTSIWMDSLRNGEFKLRNTNELIRVYRGADGLKTGHTAEAKFSLAATAKKGNFRLLSVIMGAETNTIRIAQSKRLLDYGYRNYQWKEIHPSNQTIGRVYIKEAQTEMIPVKVKNDFGVVVERGKDQLVDTQIIPKTKLIFPIKQGQQIATIEADINGKKLGRAGLYATATVKKANILTRSWRWLRDIFKGMFGKKNQKFIESMVKAFE